jgi:hypothetical protein
MKKIFESEFYNYDNHCESVERVVVYQILDEDEYWNFSNMSHQERCEYFGVFDESGYDVMPGARYCTYSFDYSLSHVIVYETLSINV